MSKEDFKVNIMMFGGRRCGKSSVLAAIYRCFDQEFGSSKLTISQSDETSFVLEQKNAEMRRYFSERTMNGRHFRPDDSPTKEEQEYQFYLSLKDKPRNRLVLNFIDYPGEYLSDKSKMDTLNGFMEKSQIIIIAVDTPFLMEQCKTNEPDEIGPYNEGRNYCERISNMVKNHFELGKGRKMILFVPLKCEKYLPEQTAVIYAKISKAYKSLIDYATSDMYRNSCQVVICPILTFGTAKFVRFEKDENGVKLDANGQPSEQVYIFNDDAQSEPSPQYCEIPMELILLYLFDTAKKSKENTMRRMNLFGRLFYSFGQSFFSWPGAYDFLEQENYFHEKLRQEKGNYKVLADPLNLEKYVR